MSVETKSVIGVPATRVKSQPNHPHARRRLVFTQFLLGLGAHLFLAVPYLRRTHGMDRLQPDRRYLFACNHVSLLDTILLGALCWRSGCYPILVLGDKAVWHASWIKRLLSRHIGFLLERGKLNPNRIEELQALAIRQRLAPDDLGKRHDACRTSIIYRPVRQSAPIGVPAQYKINHIALPRFGQPAVRLLKIAIEQIQRAK